MKNKTIFSILFILTNLYCFSQISKENVFKKYVLNDSTSKNDAVLVLYNNGTFINFGIVCNDKDKEWYIWLTSGNYLSLPEKILLKSTLEVDKMNPVLQTIKNHYKYRKDHVLIASDYESQLETYKDLPLTFDKEKLVDSSKKIEYTIIK